MLLLTNKHILDMASDGSGFGKSVIIFGAERTNPMVRRYYTDFRERTCYKFSSETEEILFKEI